MKNSTPNLHLAFAFDISYLTPFYVLLTSIFANHRSGQLHLHVIAAQLPEAEKKALVSFALQHGAELIFYDVSERIKGLVLPITEDRFTEATYYRLFLPKMVPENVSRLLFIDSDAIVVNPLRKLFEIDMKNYPAAAVIEAGSKPRPDLGILEPNTYFNAGVLLINLVEWNRQELTEKSIAFIQKYPDRLRWLDQDALNAILAGNFLPLPIRFNLRNSDIPSSLAPSQYKEYLKDKVIIHFNGLNKPWAALGRNRLRFVYHYYLKKSPRSGVKKYQDLKLHPGFLLRFVKIRCNEFAMDYPLLKRTYKISKSVVKGIIPKSLKAA